MTIRLTFLFSAIFILFAAISFAQVDSVIGQLSNSATQSFAGGVSGNGRFVVFESNGDVATENPRNADGNTEIFLFDYAQRRIFQLTDTKSVLYDPTKPATFDNVRVTIINTRPVISNDGRWIAFSSNATTSRPGAPDNTNPSLFDGNAYSSPTPTPTPSPTPATTPTPTPTPSATTTPTPSPTPTPAANPLASDGNLEMWLYQIPPYAAVADLSAGDEIPFADLSGGAFIRVTNTDPSQLPRPATSTVGAFIAEDNHDPSISDDGSVLAFTSTRDLVPAVGNAFPAEDTDEIFTYVRASGTLNQVTKTPRGTPANPIYNKNPTISGNGQRVVFASTGDNPIVGMTGGNNPLASRNEEIFYSDLAGGAPTGTKKQVTVTTPTNPGDPINILDIGRRMSRDGRYIAFDSYADLAAENGGANYTSFALYLYDTTTSTFRRILARSDADTAASGGDLARYPGFTDYDANGTPATLVLETRMDITPSGTISATGSDGLNTDPVRPMQIYSYPLNVASSAATFTRLANFPEPNSLLASTQLFPSNSLQRMVFNLSLTELGTGNFDLQTEVYYFIKPTVVGQEAHLTLAFFTGASGLPVTPAPSPSPTPTPTPTPVGTPTPTPTPTATPTPTPTPTPTGSPTPTPTPVTPAAVNGISPGMAAILTFDAGNAPAIVPRTAVGSIKRAFSLPIELSGVTMTINGVACGLKSVSPQKIEFVAPVALASAAAGTPYSVVINNRGSVIKGNIGVVPSQPDLFNREMIVGPGGRAKLFNVTNTVFRTEPFTVRTIKRKGNFFVPTVLRLYLTGVANVTANLVSIRIGNVTISGSAIKNDPVLVEPGVYTIDFELPASLNGAGDVPVVVTVVANGTFSSRLDDTSVRVLIL